VFLRVACLWTAITWIAVPLGTTYWGTLGFALGYASHVVIGNVVIAELLRRMLPEARFWRRVRTPLLAASVTAAVGRFVLTPLSADPLWFAMAAGAALVLYAAIVGIFDRQALLRAMSIVPGTDAAPDAALARVS
jgi:hypothetical protein